MKKSEWKTKCNQLAMELATSNEQLRLLKSEVAARAGLSTDWLNGSISWETVLSDIGDLGSRLKTANAFADSPAPDHWGYFQKRLLKWASSVGFNDQKWQSCLIRLKEEMGELERAFASEDKVEIADEMADLIHIMFLVADKLDVNILYHAEKKLTRNEESKWHTVDGLVRRIKNYGPTYCEHAKENPVVCPCPPGCYCFYDTCKGRVPTPDTEPLCKDCQGVKKINIGMEGDTMMSPCPTCCRQDHKFTLVKNAVHYRRYQCTDCFGIYQVTKGALGFQAPPMGGCEGKPKTRPIKDKIKLPLRPVGFTGTCDDDESWGKWVQDSLQLSIDQINKLREDVRAHKPSKEELP